MSSDRPIVREYWRATAARGLRRAHEDMKTSSGRTGDVERLLRGAIAALTLASLLAACNPLETSVENAIRSSVTVTGIELAVGADWSHGVSSLGVGDTVTATIHVTTSCGFADCVADVDIDFGSSDASVLSPGIEKMRIHGVGSRVLTAKAPGVVNVSASAQGILAYHQVKVVTDRSPVREY